MRCVKCGEPVEIEDGQPVHRGHGTSEWMLRVETVTDGYRGTELDGQIETADESTPLPRVDDWFKLVPMTREEVLDELHKGKKK